MIVGLGVDLVELSRIRAVLERHGDRFLRRVLTDDERAYCLRKRDPVPSLAARFAAKEAAAKALGTGLARGVWFRDIEVVRAETGEPGLRFHRGAQRMADLRRATRGLLTLTHGRDAAVAVVVLEREP
ncbi:MAG: holo-[acyl-carrier-protein] synthase [Acidobacteriota bacterium]|nr:MAG: holo-ACP synthase [Acidobacteriota bacterium]